ncbi:hypothetical protein BB934_45215 (plasmid) [Microvirga ossetica]|uniref:Uncharacterized protein n=1 Tax=Microvirga ossetica TaxID=1882682 RepID=A0A1B2EZR4_9HYPH|nr:hypothetical protein [Microvirga ossetica]ANY85422.1 hypothetical protein BB934_45215 [Microvirga ossetica]
MGKQRKKLDPVTEKAVRDEFIMNAPGIWDYEEIEHAKVLDFCPQREGALVFTMVRDARKPGQPIPKPGEPDGRSWVGRTYSVWRSEDGSYFRKREDSQMLSFDPPLDNKMEKQRALFGKLGFDPFERDRSRARSRADRPTMGSRTQYAADQGDRPRYTGTYGMRM